MARTTPFTTEQLDAIKVLRADNRIKNERPCGCFDILVTNTTFVVAFCDTCRAGLTDMLKMEPK